MYLSRAAMSLYSLPGLPECSNSICTSPQSWAEAFTTPFSDEKAEACGAGHAFSRDISATGPLDNSCPKVLGAL